MVQYALCPSVVEAENTSHAEAVARGCEGVTAFWWQIIPSGDRTKAVLVLNSTPVVAVNYPTINTLSQEYTENAIPEV
jgi:hypothetical protein